MFLILLKTSSWVLLYRPAEIGFLAYAEAEERVYGTSTFSSVSDVLKYPSVPIWIVLGSDHYTVLFSLDEGAAKAIRAFMSVKDNGNDASSYNHEHENGEEENGSREEICSQPEKAVRQKQLSLEFYHYNGLPPGGPRLARLRVAFEVALSNKTSKGTLTSGSIPTGMRIAMIVRRRKRSLKNERDHDEWEYEVALEHLDTTGNGEAQANSCASCHENNYSTAVDDEWRCSSCVLQGLYFMNKKGTSSCQECKKDISQCGQSLWLTYDQLPFASQREVDLCYKPKIEAVLGTLFFHSSRHGVEGQLSMNCDYFDTTRPVSL